MTRRHWTRRELLVGGGGVLAGLGCLTAAGFAGYAWPRSSAPATKPRSTGQFPVDRFRSDSCTRSFPK